MTDTERKAMALLNEVMEERGWTHYEVPRQDCSRIEALCRAIEQHEAFRQEVSDEIVKYLRGAMPQNLNRFIIAKPDPLVDYLTNNEGYFPKVAKEVADRLRSKFEIKEKQ